MYRVEFAESVDSGISSRLFETYGSAVRFRAECNEHCYHVGPVLTHFEPVCVTHFVQDARGYWI